MALTSLFTDIADAIRAKEGSTGTITASAFPDRIAALTGGGGDAISQAKTVAVTAAGQIQIGDTVYTVAGSAAAVQTDGAREELPGPVRTAAFSPDGKLLALAGMTLSQSGYIVYGSGWARLYRVKAGGTLSPLKELTWGEGSFPAVTWAGWSPDGKLLALAGSEGESYNSMTGVARIYTVAGETVTEGPELHADAAGTAFPKEIVGGVFSPGGDALFLLSNGYGSTGQTAGLYAYGITDGAVSFSVAYTEGALKVASSYLPSSLAMKPDGTRLLAGWKLFSVSGATLTAVKDLFGVSPPSVMTFSPDGGQLVTTMYGNTGDVYTVSGDTYTKTGTVEIGGSCGAMVFSPDGGMFAAVGKTTNYSTPQSSSSFFKVYAVSGSTFTLTDTPYEAARNDLEAPGMFALALSPDGGTLIAGGGASRYEGSGGSGEELTPVSEVGGVYIKGTGGSWTRKAGLCWGGGEEESAAVTAYPAPEGAIPASAAPCGVGYAKSAMAAGETGTVVVIGEITGEATT